MKECARVTKKDYIAIAEVIRNVTNSGKPIDPALLIDKLNIVFTQDNPRFNKDRFKAACLSW